MQKLDLDTCFQVKTPFFRQRLAKIAENSFHNIGPSTFQLSPADTLAGLAIKYDTSVEDIKRANGLVRDCDLWKKSGTNAIIFSINRRMFLFIPSKNSLFLNL
jgi:hypothetical protein